MTISVPPAEVARYAPSCENRHVRSGSLCMGDRKASAAALGEGEGASRVRGKEGDALVHARRCRAGPVGRLPQRHERVVGPDSEVPAGGELESGSVRGAEGDRARRGEGNCADAPASRIQVGDRRRHVRHEDLVHGLAAGEGRDLGLAVAERREERARMREQGLVRLRRFRGHSELLVLDTEVRERGRGSRRRRRTSTDLSTRLMIFCSSTSIHRMRSLVLPTTMYRPSGLHAIVMLSPYVSMTEVGLEPSASAREEGRGQVEARGGGAKGEDGRRISL